MTLAYTFAFRFGGEAITATIEAVRTQLGIPESIWHVGAYQLQKHDAPPRYIWVPTRDTFGPPHTMGGTPRALHSRLAGVDVHIHGADLGDAEWRLEALITALHMEARTSYALSGATWDEAQANERGQLVTLSMQFAIPVLDIRDGITTGQATAYTLDGAPTKATGDGYIDSDE